jgi:sugar phosphate isomerase/epimerase
MKLSIVLSTQPAAFNALVYKGALETNLAKIAALGYDGVELAVRDPGLLNARALREILNEKKLRVPAIGTGQAYGEEGLSFTHPDQAIRKRAVARIKAHIELAAGFDAHVIIGLIRGKKNESVERDQALGWLAEALTECAAFANQAGVKLAMEPINRYETNLINTASESLVLLEKVGMENLGLLLDTFHMNIEEPSFEEAIRNAGKRLFHCHIADSNRWFPGAGHLDFRRLVKILQEVGYHGYLSAEILPLPDPDCAAEKTIETMRAILH